MLLPPATVCSSACLLLQRLPLAPALASAPAAPAAPAVAARPLRPWLLPRLSSRPLRYSLSPPILPPSAACAESQCVASGLDRLGGSAAGLLEGWPRVVDGRPALPSLPLADRRRLLGRLPSPIHHLKVAAGRGRSCKCSHAAQRRRVCGDGVRACESHTHPNTTAVAFVKLASASGPHCRPIRACVWVVVHDAADWLC